jgi:HPr kinase/phosphorylase
VTIEPTIHASCVLVGAKAVLIRGASGSGKSRLALTLLQAAMRGDLPFARLVGDDRIHLEAKAGRLLARAAGELAGLLEVRGLGIRHLPYEPVAVVGLVADLGEAPERLPGGESLQTSLAGVTLPRLAFPAGIDPLPGLLEAIHRRLGPI